MEIMKIHSRDFFNVLFDRKKKKKTCTFNSYKM